jgi:hypothetical protein
MRQLHERLVLGLDRHDVLHGVQLENVKVFVNRCVEERLELVRPVFNLQLCCFLGSSRLVCRILFRFRRLEAQVLGGDVEEEPFDRVEGPVCQDIDGVDDVV